MSPERTYETAVARVEQIIKRLDSGSTSLEGWRDGAWSSREPGTTWEAVLGSSRPAMPQELREAGVPERYWIRTPHSV